MWDYAYMQCNSHIILQHVFPESAKYQITTYSWFGMIWYIWNKNIELHVMNFWQ